MSVPIVKSTAFTYPSLYVYDICSLLDGFFCFVTLLLWLCYSCCRTLLKPCLFFFHDFKQHIKITWCQCVKLKMPVENCFHMNMLFNIFILFYLLKTKCWVEWTLPWSLSREVRSNLTVQKHSNYSILLSLVPWCCSGDLPGFTFGDLFTNIIEP